MASRRVVADTWFCWPGLRVQGDSDPTEYVDIRCDILHIMDLARRERLSFVCASLWLC